MQRNSELEIDTSVLINQRNTYSSLSDASGIPLFTAPFQDTIDDVTISIQQSNEHIAEQMFQGGKLDSDDHSWLTQLLFQGGVEQVTRGGITVGQERTSSHIYPIVGLGMVLFVIALVGCCKRRNVRERGSQAEGVYKKI